MDAMRRRMNNCGATELRKANGRLECRVKKVCRMAGPVVAIGTPVDEFTGSNLTPPHLLTAFIQRSPTFTYLGTEFFLWLNRTIRPEFKLVRLQLLPSFYQHLLSS